MPVTRPPTGFGLRPEELRKILEARALLDGWRLALADAIGKAIAAHAGDVDGAAALAAEILLDSLPAAVESAVGGLGPDALSRIEAAVRRA